ncbi:MAG: polyphosphate polymerase domain-containing protein [Litorilinea sp.]
MTSLRVKTDLRHELKYLIRHDVQAQLLDELGEYLQVDAHAQADGTYPITSLYYDTPDHKFYWDKIEGHRVRRKVRVRTYDDAADDAAMTPDTVCFLEIKQRVDKLIRKRRAALPYAQAIAFDDFDTPPADLPAEAREVMQEVYYLQRTLDIRPTCIVRYHRLALEGNALYPDLRVTFDSNLRSRVHDLSLLSTDHADNSFFLPPEFMILEVKVNSNVPYWLAQMLNRHRCRLQRFSKYGAAVEHHHLAGPRRRVLVAPTTMR